MRRPILLALSLSLAALAGCGGGDDDGSETGAVQDTGTVEPLSKAEYIDRGDVICGDFRSEAESVTGEDGEKLDAALNRADYEEAANMVQEATDIAREGVDKLDALPKPTGDEQVLNRIAEERQESLAALDLLADALESEDSGRIETVIREFRSAGDELDELYAGYGYQTCGQGD